MTTEQNSFVDGLDLISNDTQLSANAYRFITNGRQRYGYIEPIPAPVKRYAPSGKKQGIISVGNVTVMFIAGKAYFQLFGNNTWILIAGFNLSATVDQIYSISVPASSLNYGRALNISGSARDAINLKADFALNGSPQCIIAQDGVSQPYILIFNETSQSFTARLTQTYDEWTNSTNGQEYVPIGLNMMYLAPILFIVSPDRSQCYRSVSGMPLNFMVNVDTDGNKLATESLGGAGSTSFAFDYDPISIISPVNITNSFVYGTQNTTRIITLDYTNTIFGEPLFDQTAIINTGILNQYSFIDILGDYAFINYDGVKSFNAVQTLRWQGRNSPFSLELSGLVKDIRQTDALCFSFNNYAVFNINTIWGYVMAIYDTLSTKWIAVDMFNLGVIKQYSIISVPSQVAMYVITEDDNFYQLYSSTGSIGTTGLATRAFSNAAVGFDEAQNKYVTTTDIKSQHLYLIFREGATDGKVTVTEIVDEVPVGQLTKDLPKFVETSTALSFELPIMFNTDTDISRLTYNFKGTKRGTKIAYYITWNSDAQLQGIKLVTNDFDDPTSGKQKTATVAATKVRQ